jgi:ketosteroid isomerase-like protein
MSEESPTPDLVERVQRIVDAVNARDMDAVMSMYAPDAVVSAVGLGAFEGHAAMRRLFEEWWGVYEESKQEAEAIDDLGNGVTLGVFLMRGRLPDSTGWVEQRYAAVDMWVDGLIRRTIYTVDLDEARAAAERLAEEQG